MTRTIDVRQARPSQEDFDAVFDFLQGLENQLFRHDAVKVFKAMLDALMVQIGKVD